MSPFMGLMLFGTVFLFLNGVQGGDKEKIEPAKTFLIKKNTDEIAKDFEKNFKEALKEYDPTPPKGGQGGAVIETGGEVQSVMGKWVGFKTGSRVDVVLDAKKVVYPNPKGKRFFVESVQGRLNTRATMKGRVVIESDTVTLRNIIGDDK